MQHTIEIWCSFLYECWRISLIFFNATQRHLIHFLQYELTKENTFFLPTQLTPLLSIAGIQPFHFWAIWPRADSRRHPGRRGLVHRSPDPHCLGCRVRRREPGHPWNGPLLLLPHLQRHLPESRVVPFRSGFHGDAQEQENGHASGSVAVYFSCLSVFGMCLLNWEGLYNVWILIILSWL